MVKKPDIQYIDSFYVHGSEARVLELKPKRRIIKTVLPLRAPDKTVKIGIDPVAICGIAVAVALLVMMAVGTVQYVRVCRQYQQMLDYTVSVQNENVQLQQEYRSRIDLDEIREKALALGMVPAEEAERISVRVEMPVAEPEMNIWEEFLWLCKGLFA